MGLLRLPAEGEHRMKYTPSNPSKAQYCALKERERKEKGLWFKISQQPLTEYGDEEE
jgi:hypothetical protein